MKKKYYIRKGSILDYGIKIGLIAIIVTSLMAICTMYESVEADAVSTSSMAVEVSTVLEAEEVSEVFFPLTDEERDLVERVVAAEGRGEPIEAQIAIAQTIRDRAVTRKQSITKVCTAANQFAAPYMGTISDKTKDAVMLAFDEGESIFDGYVTHFYAWKLIDPPYWTEDFDYLGEIGGTRFYGESF